MNDEPTAIGEVIDVYVPGGDLPEPTPSGPAPDPAKSKFVLDALTAAGLKTPFGQNIDTTEELWAVRLAAFPMDILMTAVDDWVSRDSHDFPSMGEFVSTCLRLKNRATALQAAHDHPIPGQVCMECLNTGWVDVDEGAAIGTVRPCSLCNSDLARLHKAGHFMPHHVTLGGCQECVKR